MRTQVFLDPGVSRGPCLRDRAGAGTSHPADDLRSWSPVRGARNLGNLTFRTSRQIDSIYTGKHRETNCRMNVRSSAFTRRKMSISFPISMPITLLETTGMQPCLQGLSLGFKQRSTFSLADTLQPPPLGFPSTEATPGILSNEDHRKQDLFFSRSSIVLIGSFSLEETLKKPAKARANW